MIIGFLVFFLFFFDLGVYILEKMAYRYLGKS